MTDRNCGRCHTCGSHLVKNRTEREWCPRCHKYRFYVSHGWHPWINKDDAYDECADHEWNKEEVDDES